MQRRLELHEILCGILGSRYVYFQPPESVKMTYPAIVYSLADMPNVHANDGVYLYGNRYEVIVIDKNPDSEFKDKIIELPTCRFDRSYTSDNLNHFVFSLYY